MSDCRFGVSPVNYPDPDPLKCTARSAWMHCKEKKQKNQLAVKCTARRSKFPEKLLCNFGEKWKLLIF